MHFWAEGYQTHHPGEMQQLREQGFERVALGGGRSIFLRANDAGAYRDFRAAAGRESPEGETPDQTTGIPHSTPGRDLDNVVSGRARAGESEY